MLHVYYLYERYIGKQASAHKQREQQQQQQTMDNRRRHDGSGNNLD